MNISSQNIIPPHRSDSPPAEAPNITAEDVRWRNLEDPLPKHITPESLSACLRALHDANIHDAPEQVTRFLMRVGYELYLHNAPNVTRSSSYLFESMRVGQVIQFPRADEHRTRQALSRFRSKQPYWRFTLRVSESDPYVMNLSRIA